MTSIRKRSRERARDRAGAVEEARRTSCSSGCATGARCTGPRGSPSTPTRPATGRSRRPTTSTPSAGTGRPIRPSAAASPPLTERLPARADRRRCSSAWTRPSTTASRRCSRRGFTPKRIADARGRDPRDRVDVLDRLEGRETCDLVTDVAQPVVSRVIGSFMGIPPEDDEVWARLMNAALGAGDPDLNPEGVEAVVEQRHPRDLRALPPHDRRAAREPDRRPHERARACRDRRRRSSRSTRS